MENKSRDQETGNAREETEFRVVQRQDLGGQGSGQWLKKVVVRQ